MILRLVAHRRASNAPTSIWWSCLAVGGSATLGCEQLRCNYSRLGSVLEAQLAQYGGDMKLDRIRRASERPGDLLVGLAFAQQAEHFELPSAKAEWPTIWSVALFAVWPWAMMVLGSASMLVN